MNPIEIKIESDIPDHLVKNILDQLELPEIALCAVVFSEGELRSGALGICLPKDFLPYYSDVQFFKSFERDDWQYGIFISGSVCRFAKKYPAYFCYLLSHEVCHAHTYHLNKDLFIAGCIFQEYISKASGNKLKYYELPHEQICDKFGKLISGKLFGDDKFIHEIDLIIKDPEITIENKRISYIESLPEFDSFMDYEEEMIQVIKPFKEEFKSIINELKKNTKETILNELSTQDYLDKYLI